MQTNKIIRRQGIVSVSNFFENVCSDFKDLFSGFQGVSVEENLTVQQGEDPNIKIYLDSGNKMFLKIVDDSSDGVRVSINVGQGTTDGVNKAYVDQKANGTIYGYSMVKTAYGAAFTTFQQVANTTSSVPDGTFQNFFTTFVNENGEKVNGFIFCALTKEDSTLTQSYLVTEKHDSLESIDFTKCNYGSSSNQTVLVNVTSYTKQLAAEHVYRKIQSESGKVGKIRLNNRLFFSGSHLSLEGTEST
ncbi:MAG: hypothetical protein II685_01205 [Clostridia bacterium]|nr:hypothetical protein [Clostridia bacterium]